MKKIILFGLSIMISSASMAETMKDFSSWLTQGMAEYHIPGVSIAIIKDYKIVWVQGFGMADRANSKPVTPSVLFQAGSISKPITAMAALKAVEAGKLTLDENINSVISPWKIPENAYTKNTKVTLRRLLSHSAGINVSGFLGYAQGEKLPTLMDVLNGKKPANSKPIRVVSQIGKKFVYSGGGYTIVQYALTDLYHTSFTQLMNQLVLAPLDMTSSTFQQPLAKALMTNIALPYRPDGQMVHGGPHTYIEQAAAGLWTTPTDLAKFVISVQLSLRGDPQQVLTKHFAELMAVIPESQAKDIRMGLGTLVELNRYGKTTNKGTYFSHSGQNEGYRNLIIGDTQHGNGLVIMTNMSASEDKVDKGWDFIVAIEKKIADIQKWA